MLDAKSVILLARALYRVDALGLPGNLMCKLTSSLISLEKRFREFDVEMVPHTVEKKIGMLDNENAILITCQWFLHGNLLSIENVTP